MNVEAKESECYRNHYSDVRDHFFPINDQIFRMQDCSRLSFACLTSSIVITLYTQNMYQDSKLLAPVVYFIPPRTSRISRLKSQVLKPTFLVYLKMMVKSGLEFYFQILLSPSEIPANLPGQFSHSGQIFLHWAAAVLKGLGQFQNKFQTTFLYHF